MDKYRNAGIKEAIMRTSLFLVLIVFSFVFRGYSQDLLDMLDSMEDKDAINYEQGIYKSLRLINGYTTELAGKDDLIFSISHRFGKINTGFYDLFGLDQSTIRFGFEYGLTDQLDIGMGRTNYEKLFDGFFKYKILRQSSGLKNMPVTVTLLEGITYRAQKWTNNSIDYPLSARLYYVHELLISRKFNEKISMQLVPVVIHRNLVTNRTDQNAVPAIGVGGIYKITNRFLASGEYYYLLPGKTADDFENSLSLGIEIETGGHVFQIHLSNSGGVRQNPRF